MVKQEDSEFEDGLDYIEKLGVKEEQKETKKNTECHKEKNA